MIQLSLKKKVIIITIILFMVATSVFAVITSTVITQKLEQEMTNSVTAYANKIAAEINNSRKFENIINQMIDDKIIQTGQILRYTEIENLTNEKLIEFAKDTGIAEINIVNSDRVIQYSNLPGNVSWEYPTDHNMNPVLTGQSDTYLEEPRKSETDDNFYKYGGLDLKNGYFVQIGLKLNQINELNKDVALQSMLERQAKENLIHYALQIDNDGKIVAGSKTEWIGKMYSDIEKDDTVLDVQVPLNDGETSLGSIGVGVSQESMINAKREIAKTTILLSIISMIVVSLVLFLVITHSMKPLKVINNQIQHIAQGNFNGKISTKILSFKDDIGDIANSVQTMQLSIRNMIQGVVTESNRLDESATLVSNNMEELSNQVEEVSITTEEMSSAMEETAASTEEMNATSLEIEEAINSIAQKAEDGSVSAGEISKRAEELKQTAIQSQNIATETHSTIEEHLRQAIDDAKAIEEIELLSNSILQITEQTNLLALNAAIEAARSGEAGKGFAVVAEEIRKLAEESSKTVGRIQTIATKVIHSVENLSNNSNKVLEFINTNVIKDYETLVATGEQYYQDADYVNQQMKDFSSMSRRLNESIQSMIIAINEVTTANNESAQGTSTIAEKSSDSVKTVKEVVDLAQETKESADKLKEMVEKFNI